MAISNAKVTRLGLYGGVDKPAASFAGKDEQQVQPAQTQTLMIKDMGRLMNP